MKNLYVCQIVDSVSETVVSTFTAPTPRYFDRQMDAFFKDCEKKSIPVADFEGFIVATIEVCETFNDATTLLEEGELYVYPGATYLDSASNETGKVVDEVPSNVQ